MTRQLQFVLEVEGVDYARLEVSSPGIDRPLKGVKDFERFVGQLIDLTLKAPIGAQAALGVATLMAGVPLWLGILHQLGAVALLAVATGLAWRVRRL